MLHAPIPDQFDSPRGHRGLSRGRDHRGRLCPVESLAERLDDQRLPASRRLAQGRRQTEQLSQVRACAELEHRRARRPAGTCRCDRPGRPSRGAGATGPTRPHGPRGTGRTGPAGPPGAGLTSLDDLDGLPCNGGEGTVQLTFDGANEAVLTCVPSGGGEAALSVNELMTGVTGAASNEFVEIANTGTAAADLSGWKLVYRSAAGTSDVVLATVADGTSLAAGGFFLFGGAAYTGGPAPDQSFSTSIAATGGGVGLRDAAGNLVDSVGWGTATNAFVEGTVAAAPPTTEAPGTSTGRVPDGHDTNDNGADFTLDDSPTPKAANG